jgi:hypothetical protein
MCGFARAAVEDHLQFVSASWLRQAQEEFDAAVDASIN